MPFAVVPEQLSSMPLLEMTEQQEDLLKHLPDAQHQAAARDAAIQALAAVPAKHNTAINNLFMPGQILHEKACPCPSLVSTHEFMCWSLISSKKPTLHMQAPLRKKIALNRTAIQKEVTLKIRQAHSDSTPTGAGALPKGIDDIASTVLTALKKGTL